MKRNFKKYKGLMKCKGGGTFVSITVIFCCLWMGFIFSHEPIQSEAKKSSKNTPSIKQQKREARALLTQINKEIKKGNQLVSRLKTSTKPSQEDKKMQAELRSVAQKLKTAGRDREIGPKEPKMAPDSANGQQIKGILKKELDDLKNILDSVRGMNEWLKKQNGSFTKDTKNDAKKVYLDLKKSAENTNKIAQKKKKSTS